MKRKLCMAMSMMLLAGSAPAYGAEWEVREIPHTFMAKVGTTEFLKDGEAQPLDVAVYIKDGYVMLPMRTFLSAIDAEATMTWDNGAKRAQIKLGGENFSFDLVGNRIWADNKQLKVSGEMEVSEGRVFVPLRNWANILNEYGYVVKDDDILWDEKEKIVTIRGTEVELLDMTEKFSFSGEGKAPVYSMNLTQKYDYIVGIGDGNFIAWKYEDKIVSLDEINHINYINGNYDLFLLDETGRELLQYNSEDVYQLTDQGEGYLRISQTKGNDLVIDKKGVVQFEIPYKEVGAFSEGMAFVLDINEDVEDADLGYIDTTGKMVIPLQYYDGKDFSEGLAAVSVEFPFVDTGSGVKLNDKWGYVDKTGTLVIEAKYQGSEPFRDGMARVRMDNKFGYINKEGNEVIPCQYIWGSNFKSGRAFVTDTENKTWVIDKTGEKLKLLAEGKAAWSANHGEDLGIVSAEKIIDLPNGDHKHIKTYYDTAGEISADVYNLRSTLSEGLSPIMDKETKKHGYVDENGVQIIAPLFDQAEPFQDGYAVVANEVTLENGMEDAEWGIIRHPNP